MPDAEPAPSIPPVDWSLPRLGLGALKDLAEVARWLGGINAAIRAGVRPSDDELLGLPDRLWHVSLVLDRHAAISWQSRVLGLAGVVSIAMAIADASTWISALGLILGYPMTSIGLAELHRGRQMRVWAIHLQRSLAETTKALWLPSPEPHRKE
jgi:hypothetical protein